MFRKQYIYQINLLKFKILAKEIKYIIMHPSLFFLLSHSLYRIPHRALVLESEEVYVVLEKWPHILATGLIYKLLYYKVLAYFIYFYIN